MTVEDDITRVVDSLRVLRTDLVGQLHRVNNALAALDPRVVDADEYRTLLQTPLGPIAEPGRHAHPSTSGAANPGIHLVPTPTADIPPPQLTPDHRPATFSKKDGWHICDLCDRPFRSKDGLTLHRLKVHGSGAATTTVDTPPLPDPPPAGPYVDAPTDRAVWRCDSCDWWSEHSDEAVDHEIATDSEHRTRID